MDGRRRRLLLAARTSCPRHGHLPREHSARSPPPPPSVRQLKHPSGQIWTIRTPPEASLAARLGGHPHLPRSRCRRGHLLGGVRLPPAGDEALPKGKVLLKVFLQPRDARRRHVPPRGPPAVARGEVVRPGLQLAGHLAEPLQVPAVLHRLRLQSHKGRLRGQGRVSR
eukprot:1184083-Prorocentrum_minimum.AAC.5